jgi:Flp pilus assembly protein TadD
MGMIYEKKGNKEEARKNHIQALKLNPENKEVAKALEKLKSSR